ncbi:aminopeptidase [Terrilactibacillus laevilacticus]|uniref:Aminopeptidase n=1 Tax=Terrilactibacillus laevilacticus TaxID=1380157 RepID=A0ABW5PM49_9BACI|nr:aminopeptidase [Terrilactibacillus laevilacticus]
MENFQNILEKYAEVAIKIGINLQKNQTLVIDAPIPALDYVRLVTKKAYELGAKNVIINWDDEATKRMNFEYASEEALTEFPEWLKVKYDELIKQNAAILTIYSPNPDLLQGIDPNRLSKAMKTRTEGLKHLLNAKKSATISWSIVSVPTKEWAAKIFPDLSESESMEELWKQIFHTTRMTSENPVSEWESHIERFIEKLTFLNENKFKTLHYYGSGTDLTIDLAKDHIWSGAGMNNQEGTYFVPNIPTEEVFTMPDRNGVNGTVTSTKPLNYNGNLINHFSLTFKDGRIIDYKAEEGFEILKGLIETDEGSHYLGEVALVPHHSPISDTNLIFYNTLFDENASCHLAIGFAYPFNIENGTEMTEEELAEHGANLSLVHEDFMVGSADLNIDGIKANGEKIAIFRHGNWAF